MLKLRFHRFLTPYGGHGVDKKLVDMTSDATVFWSVQVNLDCPKHSNSYVATERDGKFYVVSINGIGEIRWEVDAATAAVASFPFGGQETKDAVNYFFEEVSTDGHD